MKLQEDNFCGNVIHLWIISNYIYFSLHWVVFQFNLRWIIVLCRLFCDVCCQHCPVYVIFFYNDSKVIFCLF